MVKDSIFLVSIIIELYVEPVIVVFGFQYFAADCKWKLCAFSRFDMGIPNTIPVPGGVSVVYIIDDISVAIYFINSSFAS